MTTAEASPSPSNWRHLEPPRSKPTPPSPPPPPPLPPHRRNRAGVTRFRRFRPRRPRPRPTPPGRFQRPRPPLHHRTPTNQRGELLLLFLAFPAPPFFPLTAGHRRSSPPRRGRALGLGTSRASQRPDGSGRCPAWAQLGPTRGRTPRPPSRPGPRFGPAKGRRPRVINRAWQAQGRPVWEIVFPF